MINKLVTFRHLAVAGILCLLAASCSDVTDDSTTLPDGMCPMTFTAAVNGLTATRATTDTDDKTSWQENDPVAISMDDGANYKQYKISDANTGAMLPDGDGNTLYWSKRQETLAAWHPVNYTIGSSTGSGEVNITNQSSSFGTLENVLYAPAQEYTYSSGGSVAFTFRHALAKVKVTLKKGDGIEDSDLSNATVTFTGYTAGTLDYNGMTGSGSNGDITPKTETPADGGTTTYTALVIPQQMQGKKFIKVTIGADGATRDYFYTPAGSTDADLEAGKQYTYTITVKKSGLVVESVSSSWQDAPISSGDVSKATFRVTFSGSSFPTFTTTTGIEQIEASNVYLTTSDNSFSFTYTIPNGEDLKGFPILKGWADVARTVNNGNYTFAYTNIRSDLWLEYGDYVQVGDYYYADNTWSDSYYAEKTCLGIVFYSDVGKGDLADRYDGKLPNGIHGYVVSLRNNEKGVWATPDENSITTSTDTEAFNGYVNSQTIVNDPKYGRSTTPVPWTCINYNGGNAGNGNSGWYMPSIAQIKAWWQVWQIVEPKMKTAGGEWSKSEELWSSTWQRYHNYYCINLETGESRGLYNPNQKCSRSVLTF